MWRVVGSAKVDLAAFFTVMTLLLFSFALLTNQLFGSAERNFHNIGTSFLSLLRMMVGTLDYNYEVMRETDSTMAPTFVVLFLFIMMLVCVNFFIAILSDSYGRKKKQVDRNVASRKQVRAIPPLVQPQMYCVVPGGLTIAHTWHRSGRSQKVRLSTLR